MSTDHTLARVEAGDLTLIYAADDPTASACLISNGAALQVDQPDDVIDLAIAFMRQTAKRKAPEPAPAPVATFEPAHPEPADFQRERQIDTIAGEPVIGVVDWDTVSGSESRQEVAAELNGLYLETDGDTLFIGPTLSIPLRDLSALVELWHAGYIGKLVKFARRWCNDG